MVGDSGISYGYGYGHGHGYGYGYGYGYGSGYGYGYGTQQWKDRIAGFRTSFSQCFHVVQIGCEMHTTKVWRENWNKMALRHSVKVTKDLEKAIMTICDAAEGKTHV